MKKNMTIKHQTLIIVAIKPKSAISKCNRNQMIEGILCSKSCSEPPSKEAEFKLDIDPIQSEENADCWEVNCNFRAQIEELF
jgi:hypothetical protein